MEATHRLFLLLDNVEGGARCVEYSSLQSHTERTRALDAFRTRAATVLVASDAATRGLDVEARARAPLPPAAAVRSRHSPARTQGVDAVVSYDTPVYLKTYVHRVGRTARAGRAGQAFTLLRPQEVRHFRAMLSKADAGAVLPRTLPPADMDALAPACAAALLRVAEAVAGSQRVAQRAPTQAPGALLA